VSIPKHKTIHFIGIGGAGMSAIAYVALQKGYAVSGSDLKESITTIRLKDMGATVFIGQKASHLRKADVVVVSTAIPADNVEFSHAVQEKLPILKRAQMLDILMNDSPKRLSVAGTHGKTTTSSMAAKLLTDAGKHPTFLVGADIKTMGVNAALGSGEYFVAESDESDGSFLELKPNIAIITNVEADHLDFFKDFSTVKQYFKAFMEGVIQRQGFLILNKDDSILRELGAGCEPHIVWYGCSSNCSVSASHIKATEEGIRFELIVDGKSAGDVNLQVYGHHNVSNALSVIAFGLKEGIALDTIKKSLWGFLGTKRRFQKIGEENGICVYDDYGHHPTEIQTTLEGAKKSFPNKRVICIFQPHRYTRTRDLIDSFPDAFHAADLTVITEVYAANEKKIDHISGKLIAEKVKERHKEDVRFISKKSDIPKTLLPLLQPGDFIITMGAGDIHTVAKEIIAQLKEKSPLSKSDYAHSNTH
jgi:UDP-N-acetylmuramate--alanine ligase